MSETPVTELVPVEPLPVVDLTETWTFARNPFLVDWADKLKRVEHHMLTLPLFEELFRDRCPIQQVDASRWFEIDEQQRTELASAVTTTLNMHGMFLLVFTDIQMDMLRDLIKCLTGALPSLQDRPIELFVNSGKTHPYDVEYKRGDTFARTVLTSDEHEASNGLLTTVEPTLIQIQALSYEEVDIYRYVGIMIASQASMDKAYEAITKWVLHYG